VLDDVRVWIDQAVYEPDEIGVRFHHRLVVVHCFPNGNGRHARLMVDHFMEEQCNSAPFSWGSANLNIPGQIRSRYIDALRRADRRDYQPLLEFVRS
jgi:Fic-DOC domain mobile mystery protein B